MLPTTTLKYSWHCFVFRSCVEVKSCNQLPLEIFSLTSFVRCTKALETTFSTLHSGLAQKQRQRNPIQPNPTPAKLTQKRQLVSNERGPTWSNQWEIEEAFCAYPTKKQPCANQRLLRVSTQQNARRSLVPCSLLKEGHC